MAEQCGAQHTEPNGKSHKDWIHRCDRTRGHDEWSNTYHRCRCGFMWEIGKPIKRGCQRHPLAFDVVTDHCECAHIILQHSDADEVIEGFGYCIICCAAEYLKRG